MHCITICNTLTGDRCEEYVYTPHGSDEGAQSPQDPFCGREINGTYSSSCCCIVWVVTPAGVEDSPCGSGAQYLHRIVTQQHQAQRVYVDKPIAIQ